MTSSTETQREYRDLRDELKALLEKGRPRFLRHPVRNGAQATRSVSEITNRIYWKVGQRLARVRSAGEKKSSRALFARLAGDLGVNASLLYLSRQFYRTYPSGLPRKPDAARLAWGSHVVLLPLKDSAERLFYLGLAIDEKWSRSRLKRAIDSGLYAVETGAQKAAGLSRPGSGIHTYVGAVEKIVSGDTLDVRIDFGFYAWRVEHIRLRGVVAPEPKSKAGRAARRFVVAALSSVDFVVLKTYKTDTRDRYSADVFYDPVGRDKNAVFGSGRFLNQELLDMGHAVPL